MSIKLKHFAKILVNHTDWQRAIRCRIITQSLILFIAVFVFSLPAAAAENAIASCKTVSASNNKSASLQPKAMHYRSSAMALSMALGLRSATGPMVHTNKNRPSHTMAKVSPTTMNVIAPSSGKHAGSALARGDTGRCVTLSSLD